MSNTWDLSCYCCAWRSLFIVCCIAYVEVTKKKKNRDLSWWLTFSWAAFVIWVFFCCCCCCGCCGNVCVFLFWISTIEVGPTSRESEADTMKLCSWCQVMFHSFWFWSQWKIVSTLDRWIRIDQIHGKELKIVFWYGFTFRRLSWKTLTSWTINEWTNGNCFTGSWTKKKSIPWGKFGIQFILNLVIANTSTGEIISAGDAAAATAT